MTSQKHAITLTKTSLREQIMQARKVEAKLFLLLTLLTLAVLPAYATTTWQCITRDATNQEWSATANFKRAAVNQAFDACKQTSTKPESCKTSSADCESFIDGFPTRPMWSCTALDQMASTWVSNPYEHAIDAALAAKAYCQERSALPYTCYTNLLMCKNINPLS